MTAAALRAIRTWFATTFRPAATILALRWWRDFERAPELHAISMIVGIALLAAMKLMARLIA